MTNDKLPEWVEKAIREQYPDGGVHAIAAALGARLVLEKLRKTAEKDQAHCPKDCDCFFQQGRESVRKEVLDG